MSTAQLWASFITKFTTLYYKNMYHHGFKLVILLQLLGLCPQTHRDSAPGATPLDRPTGDFCPPNTLTLLPISTLFPPPVNEMGNSNQLVS